MPLPRQGKEIRQGSAPRWQEKGKEAGEGQEGQEGHEGDWQPDGVEVNKGALRDPEA